MARVRLYNADCLRLLDGLAASVDAVVTDPPYGIALADHDPGFSRRKRPPTMAGDTDQSVGEAALAWAARQGLPTVAFASPYRPWPGRWRNLLVWDKGPAVGRGGDPRTCWKRTWELVQVARNGPLRRGRLPAVLRHHVRPDHFTLHPAAKPVSLMVDLIEQISDPGDTILDPFMGSGSTGEACALTGRHFIGIEVDPGHFANARHRVQAARKASA